MEENWLPNWDANIIHIIPEKNAKATDQVHATGVHQRMDGTLMRKIGPFAYSVSVNENNSGVDMEIYYKGNGKNYSSYNWIQTVDSSPSDGKVNPHLDGYNLPFYLTKAQVSDAVKIARSIGYTIAMNDHPRNESSFKAITTVVGINSDGVSTTLGTLNWGYWLDNGGKVHIREVTYSH